MRWFSPGLVPLGQTDFKGNFPFIYSLEIFGWVLCFYSCLDLNGYISITGNFMGLLPSFLGIGNSLLYFCCRGPDSLVEPPLPMLSLSSPTQPSSQSQEEFSRLTELRNLKGS